MNPLLLAMSVLQGIGAPAEVPAFSVTIFASSGRDVWAAEVSEAGELTMGCGDLQRKRRLSDTELRELHRTLTANNALSLSGRYGRAVIDGLNRHLEIRQSAARASFDLAQLNATTVQPQSAGEARRGLRVYVAIRELEPTCYPEAERARDRAFLEGR